MNLQAIDFLGARATSANGPMRSGPRPRFVLVRVLDALLFRTLFSGTTARVLPPENWEGFLEDSVGAGTSAGGSEPAVRHPFDTSAAIMELRRLTGLTWEQLARLFGVTRRSLHFWASGRAMNSINEERLRRLIAVLGQADRGTAQENRAMLFRDHEGTIPFELLAAGRYDEFLRLVGLGRGRRRIELPILSRATLEARKPPPPAELVEAHQESVHRDLGRGRAVRTARDRHRGRG